MSAKILKHFQKVDPKLYEIILKIENYEELFIFRKSDNYFLSLCREIIGQQLSTKVARIIYQRFLELFPEEQVTAEILFEIPDQTLRDCGMSWNKVASLKDIAYKFIHKQIDFNSLDLLTDDQVREELIKIKGVGPWTVEMFLMFCLGREDIFSAKDLGLKKAMEKIYGVEVVNNLEEKAFCWSPYRTIASRVLWKSLEL